MNITLFYFFYQFAHQSIIGDMFITFFAQTLPYIVIVAVGLFLLFHHEVFRKKQPLRAFVQKSKEIIFVFVSSAIAWILADILKKIFQTPRPFAALTDVASVFPETGYAFPSQHATFFMALGVSMVFVHKKVGYFFVVCAVVIGLARITAGVHFPVDIMAGFVIGGFVAFVFNLIFKGKMK